MKILHSLSLCLVLALLTGCSGAGVKSFIGGFSSDPNSPLISRTVEIDTVSSLLASSGLTVYYKQASSGKVTIEAPADLMDKIEIASKDGSLSLGLTENVKSGLDRVKIEVFTPEIVEFSVSSGSELYLPDGYAPAHGEISLSSSSGADIKGNNIIADAIGMSCSSGADIEVTVAGGAVVASASSGSDIEIGGTAKTVELSASSGASVYAYGLKAATGSALASSGGSVKSNITNPTQLKESSGGGVKNSIK